MGLRSKQQFFNQLLKLLHDADSLYTRIEGEWVRPKSFDQAALIVSGFTASLAILLDRMSFEIAQDEEEDRFNAEIGKVMEEDKNKFKRLPQQDPPIDDDVKGDIV